MRGIGRGSQSELCCPPSEPYASFPENRTENNSLLLLNNSSLLKDPITKIPIENPDCHVILIDQITDYLETIIQLKAFSTHFKRCTKDGELLEGSSGKF